jgi:hypothetical protein
VSHVILSLRKLEPLAHLCHDCHCHLYSHRLIATGNNHWQNPVAPGGQFLIAAFIIQSMINASDCGWRQDMVRITNQRGTKPTRIHLFQERRLEKPWYCSIDFIVKLHSFSICEGRSCRSEPSFYDWKERVAAPPTTKQEEKSTNPEDSAYTCDYRSTARHYPLAAGIEALFRQRLSTFPSSSPRPDNGGVVTAVTVSLLTLVPSSCRFRNNVRLILCSLLLNE